MPEIHDAVQKVIEVAEVEELSQEQILGLAKTIKGLEDNGYVIIHGAAIFGLGKELEQTKAQLENQDKIKLVIAGAGVAVGLAIGEVARFIVR